MPTPPPDPGYTISSMTLNVHGQVVYEIVTDQLQRLWVAVPRAQTTVRTAHEVIVHAIRSLYVPPKPFSHPIPE